MRIRGEGVGRAIQELSGALDQNQGGEGGGRCHKKCTLFWKPKFSI